MIVTLMLEEYVQTLVELQDIKIYFMINATLKRKLIFKSQCPMHLEW